jgi:hypothetical protein
MMKLTSRCSLNLSRLPPLMYTPEGEEVAKKVWKETMQELSFAGVEKIVEDIRLAGKR